MVDCFTSRAGARTVTISCLSSGELSAFKRKHSGLPARWSDSVGFSAKPGELCLVPDTDGHLAQVWFGVDDRDSPWSYGQLPSRLPEGTYRVDEERCSPYAAALGWALGTYRFVRYRRASDSMAKLVWPSGCDRRRVQAEADGVFLGRDLINTPAEDMGPEELAQEAKDLARQHSARCRVIVGDELLKRDYPAVHAVGRASVRAPRLIDMRWGKPAAPKVTLVGKGVCFDSGGLDIKPSGGMLLMKKDMGGAATALTLAQMVMACALPIRLRVLIPAVENSVSGNAYRPLDVLRTRKGLTVEVKNTDAEGRLVMADALAEADSEKPQLLLDFATLTGAARVALGTDLPALFCNDDALCGEWLGAAEDARDPVWRMPLHTPYRRDLDSKVADLSNVSSGRFGGAITAALFLREFISPDTPWAHVDLMGWNTESKPGRPVGGEPMAARGAFAMLQRRYA